VDPPDGLRLEYHRELEGQRRPFVRWVLIGLLSFVLLLALVNVYGQWPVASEAATPAGTLELDAPQTLRGGLFFQARFVIEADAEIEQAVLVLDPGWLEDITLNTVEPAPVGEASRDGAIALELGRVPAGDEHRLYLHFQVNPTAVGRRSQDVTLYDGDRELGSIERTAFIWP
jgi:hypothetical protein